MGLIRRFKAYFLHGLAVLLPSILTIWLFVWGYTFIQENISVYINRGMVHIYALIANKNVEITDKDARAYLLDIKPELSDDEGQIEMRLRLPEIQRGARIRVLENRLEKIWVEGPGSIAGFLVALIAVCILGALLASYVGKTLWRMAENFIMSTPLLRRVYPYIKQVTDFLFTQEEQKKLFSRVVAVEYPRKGIWSIGFVTGSGIEKVVDSVRKEFLTVLIPTSPTPFTGFVIMVPKKQTIDLDMTIEQALRFTVSGGVIAPDQKQAIAALPRRNSHEQE